MGSIWRGYLIQGRCLRRSQRWIVLALVALLGGCGLKTPQAPRWSVAVQVPIAARSFDLPYIVEHAGVAGLSWLADSGAYIRIERALDTVFVGDHLKVAPVSTSSHLSIGEFEVARNAQTRSTLRLSDLYGGPTDFIASFSAQTRRSFPAMTGWSAVEVLSGQVQVVVSNQLGITLDSVAITLYNSGQSVPIATIQVGGPIATGDTALGSGSLTPGTVGTAWDYGLKFYTPGGTVLSAQDKNVGVSAQLPAGLRVTSATGIIPALAREFTDTVRVSTEHLISAATLRTGHLDVAWTNGTPLSFDVHWICPNLTRGGVPLAGDAQVNASGSFATHVDLAGCEYANTSSPSAAQIQVTAQSPGSSGAIVSVNGSDGIAVNAEISGLVLESATAALGLTSQSVQWNSFALNLPNGLGSIGLDGGTCVLSVTSTLPWPAHISGQVTNENSVSVPLSGTILPGSAAHPVASNLTVPGIAALLRPLSKEISFNTTVEYGDGITVGTVHASDFLGPRVILTSPASVYADSVSLTSDVMSTDLSSATDADRRGRLIRGEIDVSITNHLPLGAKLTLKMAADSASVDSQPSLVFGPSVIAPAPMDSLGHATGETETTLHFIVGSQDIHLFERDTLWATGDLMLIGPGHGIPSRIGTTDHIAWSASARLEVRSEAQTQTEEPK